MQKNLQSWSNYQQAIFAAIADTDRNIAVEACAGSGKTTTLQGIIQYLPTKIDRRPIKINVFAFNKSIVTELKERLPNRVSVATAHSYGYSLCLKGLGAFETGLDIDNLKYWKLAESATQKLLAEAATGGDFPDMRSEKVINQFKKSVVEVCNYFRVTLPYFNYQGIQGMLIDYNIMIPHQIKHHVIYTAMQCLHQGNQLAVKSRRLDLTDLLYIPDLLKIPVLSKPDFVLVDEAQDCSPVSLSLYRKFHEKGSRMILLGDSSQAIFAFAGSMSDAFPTIKRIFNCVELPLSITYRCPRSHVELAAQLVPDIKAAPNAKTGTIATKTRTDLIDEVLPGDVVLSRFTAPLVETCLKLNLAGKNSFLRGGDVGENLAAKAKSIAGHQPLARFMTSLHDWVTYALDQMDEDDDSILITEIENTAMALEHCYRAFGRDCVNGEEFGERIKGMFKPETEDSIILSTIHSFKGGEAMRVWLLDTETLPIERDSDKDAAQELNLLYVALTRSKRDLFLVPSLPIDCPVGGIAGLDPVDFSKLPVDAIATHKPKKQEQLSLL